MIWTVYCVDSDNSKPKRDALRVKHRAYLDTYDERIFYSGPLVVDEGDRNGVGQVGSLFILNVPDRSAAEQFINNEPYNMGGVFKSVSVTRMRGRRFRADLSNHEPVHG